MYKVPPYLLLVIRLIISINLRQIRYYIFVSDRETRMYILGDSISAGQFIDQDKKFTQLLQKSNFFKDRNIMLHVDAISGQTSRQALLYFPEKLQIHKIDFLLIQLGINDSNYWLSEGGSHPRVSVESFRANIMEIIARAHLNNISRIVLLTNHKLNKKIIVNDKTSSLEDSKQIYDDALRELAQTNGVSCYDISKEWANISNFSGEKLLLDDGVHLSEIGHGQYALIIENFLKNDEFFL
jgi:lysophospholipase L1-like esterase